MMIRLYCDEDSVRHALVLSLRKRGVDIITAIESKMIGKTDEQQLAYAAAQGRAIYSFNMGHFCRLHADFLASGREHSGIVVSRQQRYNVGEQMRRLLKLVAGRTAEEMHNQLEFLSDWA